MTGTDFLPVAARLANGPTEADWRTAVGRAYYAVFHVARQLLEDLGFCVPRADRAHAYMWLRLSNSGDVQVERAAADVQLMRKHRNHADYDLRKPLKQTVAAGDVQMAHGIVQALTLAGPARAQITAAMRVYERDVLGDMTWQGP